MDIRTLRGARVIAKMGGGTVWVSPVAMYPASDTLCSPKQFRFQVVFLNKSIKTRHLIV